MTLAERGLDTLEIEPPLLSPDYRGHAGAGRGGCRGLDREERKWGGGSQGRTDA